MAELFLMEAYGVVEVHRNVSFFFSFFGAIWSLPSLLNATSIEWHVCPEMLLIGCKVNEGTP